MPNNYEIEFITITTLCSILHIGKNTAYKLLNQGDIEAFRIGRVWKIPKTSVDRYITSNTYTN